MPKNKLNLRNIEMNKTILIAASLLLCACGGQKASQPAAETADNQKAKTEQQAAKPEAKPAEKPEEKVADEPAPDESVLREKLREQGYNYYHFEDIDGDGKDEILAADFDPAEGGIVYSIGVHLKDKDATCVARTKGDRQDVGFQKGIVAKMTLDDQGKEHYEIFEIKNSKATPAPEGTLIPDYKSLSSFDIESWTENYPEM